MYEGLLFCFISFVSTSLAPNSVARKISDRRPVLANQLPIISSPVHRRRLQHLPRLDNTAPTVSINISRVPEGDAAISSVGERLERIFAITMTVNRRPDTCACFSAGRAE